MSKYDFDDVITSVKTDILEENKKKKKEENKLNIDFGLGTSLTAPSLNKEDYIIMEPWWEESFGIPGLPFGKIIQAAGDSDTGKTSLCIEAMRKAQEQDKFIVYAETEMKTTEDDLKAWGVDPERVAIVKTNITEKVFVGVFKILDKFFSKYPNGEVLLLIDSFGNTISRHDEQLNMHTDSAKVGGAAKSNRVGLGKLIAMMEKYRIAPLIINYHYANMGTHGNTQAGGKALKFYTTLGITTSRVKDLTSKAGGYEHKTGIQARWTPFKNHFAKGLKKENGETRFLPKSVDLEITYEGIKKI